MAIEVRVIATCRSGDEHHHITHLVDDREQQWPVSEVIERTEAKALLFYTLVGGKRADVGVQRVGLRAWVQTYADRYWNNNLLALPTRRRAA